ncbi:MAG TPA: chloride channel protein [Flavobacteriales bacterium]|nr:chloride channel protein [Flavobacteriales bacterium]
MTLWRRITEWHEKVLGENTLMVLSAITTGLLAALAAVVLKQGVNEGTRVLHGWLFGSQRALLVLIIPTTGILLSTLFTQVWLKGDLGRGLPSLLNEVRNKAGVVQRHKLYSQVITSIFTMGSGGSAGMEAPIATTGAAFGSRLGLRLGLDESNRNLLLACGSAAGISAIFNAPIAGAIFAMEVVLVNVAITHVVPVLIASASAAFLSSLIYAGQPFVLVTDSWNTAALPWYIGLAFFTALVAAYGIRSYFIIGDRFKAMKRPYVRALIGGTMLGVLILFFPPLLGEGYDGVVKLLHSDAAGLAEHAPVMLSLGGWNLEALVIGLMMLKVLATSFTVSAGGNGGMFGSSLFTGAMAGFAFAHGVNLLGLASLNEVNFTVVGMAAVLSGTIHVPLTAIFLIAEITGGYALFVPLMIVSSLSYLGSRWMIPYSVYSRPEEKG